MCFCSYNKTWYLQQSRMEWNGIQVPHSLFLSNLMPLNSKSVYCLILLFHVLSILHTTNQQTSIENRLCSTKLCTAFQQSRLRDNNCGLVIVLILFVGGTFDVVDRSLNASAHLCSALINQIMNMQCSSFSDAVLHIALGIRCYLRTQMNLLNTTCADLLIQHALYWDSDALNSKYVFNAKDTMHGTEAKQYWLKQLTNFWWVLWVVWCKCDFLIRLLQFHSVERCQIYKIEHFHFHTGNYYCHFIASIMLLFVQGE